MNLKRAFNETFTENGDRAYSSSNNKYFDFIFKLPEYRHNPHLITLKLDKENEFDLWFGRMIRDCREGFGERAVGRVLLEQLEEKPENILQIGRADDIFHIGLNKVKTKEDLRGGIYWNYLRNYLSDDKGMKDYMTDFNIKKWMPRNTRSHRYIVTLFRKSFDKEIAPKTYQKWIKNDNTVESFLCRKEKIKDYSTVPSLAMLRYFKSFVKNDTERFNEFLESVKKGKSKINTSVMTPYDLTKKYWREEINGEDCDIIFNQIKKVELPKIISIVDNSGSMHDSYDSHLKAKAIGHYVAKNSPYMTNHIITFSDYPELVELSDNYNSDMEILNSYDDIGSTDFGKVIGCLSKVTEDLPDFILVLSDMQFNEGSSDSKEEAMQILRERNPNMKIIWWNFCSRKTTFPETDEYGNIFMSGYNPKLLELLELGFDGDKYILKLVNNYKEKMKDKLK